MAHKFHISKYVYMQFEQYNAYWLNDTLLYPANGLVIQSFQTVAGDIFLLSVGPKRSANPRLNCALEIRLLINVLTMFYPVSNKKYRFTILN